MSETERIRVGEPMPSIEKVAASDATRVLVTWGSGSRKATATDVDLAPLIYSRKVLAPLRNDPSLFQTVHIVEGGAAIAWGDGDEIDIAATTVERLADESMTPADFSAFLQRHSLSFDAAAAQLGISRRLVAYYVKEREIPRYIALACAYLDTALPSAAESVSAHHSNWPTSEKGCQPPAGQANEGLIDGVEIGRGVHRRQSGKGASGSRPNASVAASQAGSRSA